MIRGVFSRNLASVAIFLVWLTTFTVVSYCITQQGGLAFVVRRTYAFLRCRFVGAAGDSTRVTSELLLLSFLVDFPHLRVGVRPNIEPRVWVFLGAYHDCKAAVRAASVDAVHDCSEITSGYWVKHGLDGGGLGAASTLTRGTVRNV